MAKVKISELPALTPATLDTTYVVGISGSTTYKISINQLTSSLDTTFATDLVTAALSSSLNSKLSTSSFNSYTSSYTTDSSSFDNRIKNSQPIGYLTTASYTTDSASFNSRIISGSSVAGTISSSTQISNLGFVTGAYTTLNSFNSLTQSFNSISQSFTTISGSFGSIDFSGINEITSSYLLFTQSYYSASASFDTRIDGLENATSSYLTSLNGAISSSAQVLNGSGIFSSSTQLPAGLVSGSSQIFIGSGVASGSYETTGRGIYSSSAQLPIGIISSSSQLENATITNLTITNLTTVNETSSVIYSSGSNQLGDALNDTQILSGSIKLVGTGSLNGYTILTSNDTASFLTSLNGAISSSAQVLNGSGIFSSSAQLPSGLISSSTQLPSNLISGSSQISTLGFITGSYISSSTYTTDSSSFNSRIISGSAVAGTISGSSQIAALGYATTSSVTIISASAWGAFQSASSYSSSLQSSITTLSSSLATSITSVSGTFTNLTVNGQPTTYGVVNGSYLLAQNNAEQTGVGNGTAISFQTTNASNGSLITKGSNTQVTLTAGNTYKLEAIIRRFTSTSSWATFRWYDVTNSAYVGIEAFGEMTTSTMGVASTGIATYYVTPSVNTTYELRQTTANTITVSSEYASIEITQINPTIAFSGSTDFTQITNKPTLISGSSQLTTAFPSKTTGAWSVPAGASTQSFTVEAGASYTMWVNGNIPNGIITWNATVTTSNTNVPVVGSQYGWYYTVGNALVLTAMPDQIIGTTNTLISSPTSYAPNTSNVFKFGITNNSGTTQTINYGYIKLS